MSSQEPVPTAPTQPVPTPLPAPDPVSFKSNVKDGAANVKVDTLVSVSSDWGTLTKVKLTYAGKDRQGRTERGTIAGKAKTARNGRLLNDLSQRRRTS